ncbi:MAG: SCP2 sterol-binding domain-containing protein [Chloroflexi bacterium]|nr:SCP2 sterol-binding domain-containing protein [Chloroflexota bacterium]
MTNNRQTLDELFRSFNDELQAQAESATSYTRSPASIRFTFTDMPGTLTLRFAKNEINSSLDDADPVTIGVQSTFKLLDDILSGRQDPESAYMSGKLRLVGDEYTAGLFVANYLPAVKRAWQVARGQA